MNLLVAGGGTGGHVLAGVAVADVWARQAGRGAQSVLFVGAQGGIEVKIVPRSGYSLDLLEVGSLNRVSWKTRFRTAFQLPKAFLRSAKILMKWKPVAVLGVGGYSSGPMVLMAWCLRLLGLLHCRIGILEQNSVPGMTNRILGRFADTIFAAFPGLEGQFPRKSVLVTGNPIRSSMKKMAPAQPDPFTVFIFGGSQGALGMNTLVLDALPYIARSELKDHLRFIHQTGEKDYDRVKQAYEKAGLQARIEKFIYDMPSCYSAASLLICRAGSSTLAELAAVGRAGVLVPLPTATNNHQEQNARVFVEAGAALLLRQQDSSGADLFRLVSEAFSAPERLRALEASVAQFFRPKAADEIAEKLSSNAVILE